MPKSAKDRKKKEKLHGTLTHEPRCQNLTPQKTEEPILPSGVWKQRTVLTLENLYS